VRKQNEMAADIEKLLRHNEVVLKLFEFKSL